MSNPRGSGLRELLEQLMIMQWENARVSSERPLALVIVKLNKIAKTVANYLARCPQLARRNVKTTFVDGQYFSPFPSLIRFYVVSSGVLILAVESYARFRRL